MISVLFQGKPFNIKVIQVCAPTSNAEEAEDEQFYETKNSWPFHYRGMECKSGKSRDTGSNRKIWPWSTKWIRAKANRVFPREHTGHSKYPLPATLEKIPHMDITRWSTLKLDWLYSLQPKMEKLYTVSRELTVAQITNSLLPNSNLNWRKVVKATRPFRYDLNQIPYDYTVEVLTLRITFWSKPLFFNYSIKMKSNTEFLQYTLNLKTKAHNL